MFRTGVRAEGRKEGEVGNQEFITAITEFTAITLLIQSHLSFRKNLLKRHRGSRPFYQRNYGDDTSLSTVYLDYGNKLDDFIGAKLPSSARQPSINCSR